MNESILDQAILFAVEAHKGQKRKDGAPFILHPLEDAAVVAGMTQDEAVLAAAVLHDTVEDTAVTPEAILENFGERVYELVMHETENKRPELPSSKTWRIRKEESLQCLAQTEDLAVKMLWLGDKLSNMRGLHRRYEKEGEAFLTGFNNGDPAEQKWYYGTVLELLAPLADTAAYREYAALYHDLFDRF